MNDFWLKARRGLLGIVYPISENVGHARAPWSRKLMTSKNYREVLPLLQPGDVLLSRTQGELANVFIPGFWAHAFMYTGGEMLIEAIGKGVVETDLIDGVLTKDYLMVRRPSFANEAQRTEAAAWAKTKLGAAYDFFFNHTNEAFYCSELVWMAYEASVGPEVPFTLRKTLGLDTVIPDDIGAADKHWVTLYDSRLTVSKKLLAP